MELGITIVANFPATAHFAGPWDTEGGRQARALITNCLNYRDDKDGQHVIDAKDNVCVLHKIMNKAGTPAPPIASQEQYRTNVNADSSPASSSVTASSSATASTSVVSVPAPKPRRVRQCRGRTVEQMQQDEHGDVRYEITRRHIWHIEPCGCRSRSDCRCPEDGRLTYRRNDKFDCTAVPGTLSTYCYKFDRKALHLSVRQFSCYCRWCSDGQWDKCVQLDVVRHCPEKPIRPLQAGHKMWRDQGWRSVELHAKSPASPAVTRVATQSVDAARAYVSKLRKGVTFVVTTVINGTQDYWLACKKSEIHKSPVTDGTTGVKKGEEILTIVWYDRMSSLKYMKLDYETVVSVSSVLVTVSNISWLRVTPSRFYLGETTHNKLTDIVQNMSHL